MSEIAVYDTMLFFQWAVLPPEQPQRIHATIRLLENRRIRLAMSQALLAEIRKVLTDVELRQHYPSLTPEHVNTILDRTLDYADMYDPLPDRFSLSEHTKDDHLFNLAIESKARFLVTWENRLLALAGDSSSDAERLRSVAPSLSIVSPPTIAQTFRGDARLP